MTQDKKVEEAPSYNIRKQKTDLDVLQAIGAAQADRATRETRKRDFFLCHYSHRDGGNSQCQQINKCLLLYIYERSVKNCRRPLSLMLNASGLVRKKWTQ
jgi:hypothetical protein